MRVLTERGAESFLKKKGFEIIETSFVRDENKLEKEFKKFKTPVVLKVASKKIVHKTKVNGIKKNIQTLNQAKKAFRELMKIKNAQGVLIQKQISGKEYLVGLKKTQDFGYVIGFGAGGSKVEKMKKIDFRVCNLPGVNDILNSYGLSVKKSVEKIFDRLCKLAESQEKIKALDINPLILEKGKALIVDAQIVFE